MSTNPNDPRFAVIMTPSSNKATFIDCSINGAIKIAGKDHTFIRTKIYAFKREHPFWFWLSTIGLAVGIIASLITIYQFFLIK
ncbi:MAG: hypothetical protein WC477_03665 [Patescibacteria group bacterium]